MELGGRSCRSGGRRRRHVSARVGGGVAVAHDGNSALISLVFLVFGNFAEQTCFLRIPNGVGTNGVESPEEPKKNQKRTQTDPARTLESPNGDEKK